jgi:hypothetical protein
MGRLTKRYRTSAFCARYEDEALSLPGAALLILGAASVLRFLRKNTVVPTWLAALRERRPFKVAAVALAHKMARIVWALLVKGGVYRAAVPAAAMS